MDASVREGRLPWAVPLPLKRRSAVSPSKPGRVEGLRLTMPADGPIASRRSGIEFGLWTEAPVPDGDVRTVNDLPIDHGEGV
jgi:hypothetical protein